jgi:hypothetical protein
VIRILILSVGTAANYHLIKSLKEKFQNCFCIIGTDTNESHLVACCHYLDRFYVVPPSISRNFYNIILGICEKECVDFIIPSFDADQRLFFPENKDLFNLEIVSLSTSHKILPIYENKLTMHAFLHSKGFPLPRVYDIAELSDAKKYFIKPINGVASKGACMMQGFEIKKQSFAEDLLIQELCYPPEYTVECFSYLNKIASVTRERLDSKAGVCVKARVFHHEELEAIVENLSKAFNEPLFFNVQFMKNANDKFVITDINLRLAGGMSLSCAAGWDEASAIACLMLSRNEQIFKCLKLNSVEQYVVRAYADIVTKAVK